jgi:hypothetical protein
MAPVPIRQLLFAQGAYYAAAGLWPLVHMRSFLGVTGPKSDLWLVKTVALLIIAIGASLITAAYIAAPGPESYVLAVGSAVALTAVDVVYSIKRRISYVYLADAAAEVALLWLWAFAAATGA